MSMTPLVAAVLQLLSVQSAPSIAPVGSDDVTACVGRYAEIVSAEYAHALRAAESMRAAIRPISEAATETRRGRAREAWNAPPAAYRRTAALRGGHRPRGRKHEDHPSPDFW